MKGFFFLSILVIFQFSAFAQQNEESKAEESRHSISFVIGHARIGQGRNAAGDKEFLAVPSVAIDYNYWISERWGLGIHSDFLNENFFIENEDGEILERERPIAPALMGVFKPGEHWTFSLGIGKEFAGKENFTLTRISIEYGVEIQKGWEVFGVLSQDFRWSAYNVTTIGLGLSKKL
jgi:hypothetical protein